MYNGYIYSKDDVRSPFVKPPWPALMVDANFSTLEAPLIAGKAPCMYNGYIYSKDDVRSPFVNLLGYIS
jgi:hypothetical protein